MTDTTKLLPCPFCGPNDIDPEGWVSTDSAGPACNDCSASAQSVEAWSRRAPPSPGLSCDTLVLVGWLRRRENYDGYGSAFKQCADQIESLSAENARLREALRIFVSKIEEHISELPDETYELSDFYAWAFRLTWDDLRKARQALGDAPDAS